VNLYAFGQNDALNGFDPLGDTFWTSPAAMRATFGWAGGGSGKGVYGSAVGAGYGLFYNSDQLANQLLDHYMEGSGNAFWLSEDQMRAVRVEKISILNRHRNVPPNKSFAEYLKELTAKGCDCVEVKGLRVEGGALANGTLAGFTIIYYGQLCLPIKGNKSYWEFTGKMQFYDYWNFESHAGRDSQRSARGEADVKTAQKWIIGRPFSVYSVAVDATESYGSGETISSVMGGASDASDFNRRNAGDLR
jgi:hypothetical protein